MSMEHPPIAPVPGGGPQPQQPYNRRHVVGHAVSRYGGRIVLSTLLGMLAGLLVTVAVRETIRPEFAARADLVVQPSAGEAHILNAADNAPLFTYTPEQLIADTSKRVLAEQTARALVQTHIATRAPMSGLVGEAAILAQAKELQDRLHLSPIPDSRGVRIEVKSCDTQHEANQTAEFAARVFLDVTRQLRLEQARTEREHLDKQIAHLGERLTEAERAVWEFQQKAGFKSATKRYGEMSAKKQELQEIRVTKQTITAKLDELTTELGRIHEKLPEALSQPTDEVVTRLFNALDELLTERRERSAVYQPQHPDMKILEEKIQEQQQVIRDTIRDLDQETTGGSNLWQQRQQLFRQQVEQRMRLASLDNREASLRKMLDELVADLPDQPGEHLEYQRLAAAKKTIGKNLECAIERKWRLTNIPGDAPGPVARYNTVRAHTTPRPMAGHSWINVGIGGAAGLVLALGACVITAANDTTVRTAADVAASVNLEVLGAIPKMRFGPARGLFKRRRATCVPTGNEEQLDACVVTRHAPESPIAQAYRALRTNFQFATVNKKAKTVMVTSAAPGEGKTTTVMNLAVAMAAQGMRVLVVDTDLRQPNVHRVLRMERGPGLADVLREGRDPSDVIRTARVENLWVVSAGALPPNPAALIDSPRMSEVLERFRAEFDCVICDAASVLVVTDPALLADKVDTCLLVCAAGFTQRAVLRRATKLLQTARGTVAGVVLNNLETIPRHDGYYGFEEDAGARRPE
ncbi:MAG: polysaccharide biosynthesis tyrosine autokinase [Candidatus Hydrogenedentota bacterium]